MVLFSDVLRLVTQDHPAPSNVESGRLQRYPHISICWEQSDTWALDNVLQELGRERTIAMSLPEFEQSLFMAAQPTICYWRPRRATVSTINSINAVGCSSSPV